MKMREELKPGDAIEVVGVDGLTLWVNKKSSTGAVGFGEVTYGEGDSGHMAW